MSKNSGGADSYIASRDVISMALVGARAVRRQPHRTSLSESKMASVQNGY